MILIVITTWFCLENRRESYNIGLEAVYAPDNPTKKALNTYRGVSYGDFYEQDVSNSINIDLVNDIKGNLSADSGKKKILASVMASTPEYLAFLFRIALTAFLLLAISRFVLSFFPAGRLRRRLNMKNHKKMPKNNKNKKIAVILAILIVFFGLGAKQSGSRKLELRQRHQPLQAEARLINRWKIFPALIPPAATGRLMSRLFINLPSGQWALPLFFMIMVGGFMYITSAGNQATMGKAKGYITDAIIGLIMAMAAYLLLYEINPDLLKVNVPKDMSLATSGTGTGAVSPRQIPNYRTAGSL